MKRLLLGYSFLLSISSLAQIPYCEKIIVITIDGVRWQEIYEGADKNILFDIRATAPGHPSRTAFWKEDTIERRAALLPFLWTYIAQHGQLFGNRKKGNFMQVKNRSRFSYAGYNELFTGYADKSIIGNKPVYNKNINILEYLNNLPDHKNSVAAFTSWNLFPYIFNKQRSNLVLNSGEHPTEHAVAGEQSLQKEQQFTGSYTRKDSVTYAAAKKYLISNHPKIMHIGFGEADEFAHHKNYSEYLSNIHEVDGYIADLWQTVQQEEDYRNKTIFIITTDHGRGAKTKNWNKHGMLVSGSNQTWMAVFGNCIKPGGRITTGETIYTAQIAETIANLFGEKFVQPRSYSNSLLTTLQ